MARAYSELSTCRSFTSGGIGPIPITAMWDWCAYHSLNRDATDFVVAVLRSVDAETIRRAAARAREAAKGAKS